MKNPKISILTSTYNSSASLQRCLDSVKSQSYTNIEHIIIDNCSNDGTIDIIRDNEATGRISWWLSEPDSGIYHAWNKALPHCSGDWVLFLGSDDELANPDCISQAVEKLVDIPESIYVAYGIASLCDENGGEIRSLGQDWEIGKELLKKGVMLPHVATFHRASMFDKHGNFDESFKLAGDMDFLLRELKENDAEFLGITMTKHYRGGVTTLSANRFTGKDEIMRIAKKYDIGVPWDKSFLKNFWYSLRAKMKNYFNIDITRR